MAADAMNKNKIIRHHWLPYMSATLHKRVDTSDSFVDPQNWAT